MKKIFFITICCYFTSCGFKGPPTPMFPTSTTRVDDEVKRRDLEQQQEKELEKKQKEIEQKTQQNEFDTLKGPAYESN